MLTISHYPKATVNRLHGHDKAIVGARMSLLKLAFYNLAILQVLFFLLFCYLFGSIFQQSSHVHNMHVLYVDYDGGLIGSAVKQGYGALQGKDFPTLNEGSVTQYPTPGDIDKAVCSTKYWAAIYTSPGATTRLEQGMYTWRSLASILFSLRYSLSVDHVCSAFVYCFTLPELSMQGSQADK